MGRAIRMDLDRRSDTEYSQGCWQIVDVVTGTR